MGKPDILSSQSPIQPFGQEHSTSPQKEIMQFGELRVFDPENPRDVAALSAVDVATSLTGTNTYDTGSFPTEGSTMSEAEIRQWMIDCEATLRGITDQDGNVVGFIDLSTVWGPTREHLGDQLGPGTQHKELSAGRLLNVPDEVFTQSVATYTEEIANLPATARPHALWIFADTTNPAEKSDFEALTAGVFTAIKKEGPDGSPMTIPYDVGGVPVRIGVWRPPEVRIPLPVPPPVI